MYKNKLKDILYFKNPDSSVKEIYLCDTRKELITHFENAVKKVLQRSWFVFEHKRTRRQTPPKITVDSGKSLPKPITYQSKVSFKAYPGLGLHTSSIQV